MRAHGEAADEEEELRVDVLPRARSRCASGADRTQRAGSSRVVGARGRSGGDSAWRAEVAVHVLLQHVRQQVCSCGGGKR